jgi:hypothetical protein
LQTGQRIGAYIVQALGTGAGRCLSCRAGRRLFRKEVAIKILKPTGKAGDLVQRFAQNAKV